VSAFGATGSNVHIILEEAPERGDDTPRTPRPVLILLSAKDADRLRAYAEKLRRFLEDERDVDLSALAFTLQTGRVELEERLIFVAHTADDAARTLDELLRGRAPANLWRGRLDEPPAAGRLLDDDDVVRDLVARWSSRGKWSKLAELWLQGYSVDWRILYDTAPRRLHLPAYPFARDRVRALSASQRTYVSTTLPPIARQPRRAT
jgi:polyketide synthase PksJ